MSFVRDFKNTFQNKGNALLQLIVINSVAFVLLNISVAVCRLTGYSDDEILQWFLLPSRFNTFFQKAWTLFSYMFLHLSLWHIFSNMLWLFWVGGIFKEYLGSKRLLSVYILGGLSGGILYLLLSNIPVFYAETHLLGASASVMAIVVATAVFLPEYSIHLLFIGPIRLKYLALISFILTTLIDLSQNTGGKIAHIGGALFGMVYMVQYKKGKDMSVAFYKALDFISFRRKKMKLVHKKENVIMSKASLQKKVDEILDKIARSGYESLNKEEKEILFKASDRI